MVVQLKLRLKTLLDKKKVMQSRSATTSKLSASFITLEEGFQQFGNDLNKLQVSRLRDVRRISSTALNVSSNLSRSMRLPSRKSSRKQVTPLDVTRRRVANPI